MRYPLYEALPMLYVMGGAAAGLGIDEIYGRACGVLLLLAGLAIRSMRLRYRKTCPVDVATIASRW
jgi:hypothetical protein